MKIKSTKIFVRHMMREKGRKNCRKIVSQSNTWVIRGWRVCWVSLGQVCVQGWAGATRAPGAAEQGGRAGV